MSRRFYNRFKFVKKFSKIPYCETFYIYRVILNACEESADFTATPKTNRLIFCGSA